MLIYLLSFLLILTSSTSVSLMIKQSCLTNHDCSFESICDKQTNTCTCPKPYFSYKNNDNCYGCAPGWIEFETNKCLLFAISHSSGVTWYQAQTICIELLAQPITINNINDFNALENKIDYLLKGNNALAASLYFHQGAWIKLNNKSIESYTLCTNNDIGNSFDCVQIRQNSTTNKICLQYVPCNERSHFICEALPVIQSELEKNTLKAKQLVENNQNDEEILDRHPRQVTSTPVAVVAAGLGNQIMMTTKKSSSFNFDTIAGLISNGLTAVGHVSNAIGSYYGSKNQPAPAPVNSIYPQIQMPQALAGDDDSSSSSGILLFGGVAFIIIIIIVIVVVFVMRSKKKRPVASASSMRSTDSDTSTGSDE